MNPLEEKADFIRREVLRVSIRNNAGHIAPSLSCVDILVALYYDVLSYNSRDPYWEDRDRLIFSKSHGCYALYAILADKEIIPRHEWEEFNTAGSSLNGCAERRVEYGLEAGCGSLGHGLPLAVGSAFGAKLMSVGYHTFCICGDGELQEGTTWEALQFAVKHELGNLTLVVDHNRLQAMDFTKNILDRSDDDLIQKMTGFGLKPKICNGHDTGEISRILGVFRRSSHTTPNVLIAHTVKGFGLRCMENIPKFHFRVPCEEEMKMDRSYGKLS